MRELVNAKLREIKSVFHGFLDELRDESRELRESLREIKKKSSSPPEAWYIRYAYALRIAKSLYAPWVRYERRTTGRPESDRAALRARYRRMAVAYAVNTARIAPYIGFIVGAAMIAGIIVVLVVSDLLHGLSARDYAPVILGHLAILCLLASLIPFRARVVRNSTITLAGAGVLYFLLRVPLPHALNSTAVSVAVSVLTVLFLHAVDSIEARIAERHYDPETFIAYSLLNALDDMGSPQFSRLRFRRGAVTSLEYAASALENKIPRLLNGMDPVVRDALSERCARAGDALRDYGKRIVLFDQADKEKLHGDIESVLEVVLTGTYDALPVGAPQEGRKARKAGAYLLGVLRTLVIAPIPFACLEATRLLQWRLSDGLQDAALIFSLAWAAVALIALLDPLYKSRLNAVQDFIGILKPPDKTT
ncbi:hypothetical protein Skr01_68870 [Sphaerisporangium krabiense]|uniref:Uncharacterized protein n=1 Tax=Sphaerisporangium krabiense TaxID=763782 RepID=A0A7W8Z6V9_9ACTN|nr:hypothetical protein [Sphaerisporangium krabiense]MBB5628459.1 hypothetical protein [Sphaerisporangium krabiense]GII66802.1 hypothetical protein Skr01_68870 [Sphaerisporangium krabiense]